MGHGISKAYRRRKGVMLLQTLVLSVVMMLIAVMVMKWVMARYMISSRVYRSATAKVRTEGCAYQYMARWNFSTTAPSSTGCNPDGISATISVSGTAVRTSITED